MSYFYRKYDLKGGREVEVRITSPVQLEELQGDWQCTYQVIGLGSSKERRSPGVDPIQSLYLALQYVATTLYSSAEFERGELSWFGKADLGLPIVENLREHVGLLIANVEKLMATARPD